MQNKKFAKYIDKKVIKLIYNFITLQLICIKKLKGGGITMEIDNNNYTFEDFWDGPRSRFLNLLYLYE